MGVGFEPNCLMIMECTYSVRFGRKHMGLQHSLEKLTPPNRHKHLHCNRHLKWSDNPPTENAETGTPMIGPTGFLIPGHQSFSDPHRDSRIHKLIQDQGPTAAKNWSDPPALSGSENTSLTLCFTFRPLETVVCIISQGSLYFSFKNIIPTKGHSPLKC